MNLEGLEANYATAETNNIKDVGVSYTMKFIIDV
jgi:hypothetical protein